MCIRACSLLIVVFLINAIIKKGIGQYWFTGGTSKSTVAVLKGCSVKRVFYTDFTCSRPGGMNYANRTIFFIKLSIFKQSKIIHSQPCLYY